MGNKLFLACAFLFVASCARDAPEVTKIQGFTMGTGYSVMWTKQTNLQAENTQIEVDALLLAINKQMSTYDKDSELSLFNRAPAPYTQEISQEFADVLNLSLKIHALSKGFFDISVGPLVNLWGFGPDKATRLVPTNAQIKNAQSLIGLNAVALEGRVLKKTADRYIDLSLIHISEPTRPY